MITLQNLQHTYVSKKGSKVVALKNVNYTFSNCGMYFLVGKSGSGKSTLLNLLSGIDKLQDGEIIIDGEKLSKYSEKDYNNHRNNYAGIIFQEFNLIDSMTVFENIDMALKLQGKIDNDEVISNCLTKVGLNGYQNRFPAELSGGERQRVSIARQLAKGSKVILADEPTGSLDSENGKNVFEIFKALSKEVLIIVASHDLEFAETYGDEILTFVDGELVNARNIKSIPESSSVRRQLKTNEKFPTKYAFHFAFRNILNKKIRFLISCLLCFVSLAMFGMFVNILNYTSEKAIAHTLVNKGDKTISAGVGYYDEEEGLYNTTVSFSNLFNKKQLNYVDETYPKSDFIRFANMENRFYIRSTKKGDSFFSAGLNPNYLVALVKDEQDIAFYGFSLAKGSLPLTDDSVYITDYYASVIIWAEYNYLVDDVLVPISEDESIYSLIGKTIIKDEQSSNALKIAGIIDTDFTEERLTNNVSIYTSLFATDGYFASQRNRITVSDNGTNVFNLKVDYKDIPVGMVISDKMIQNTNNAANNNVVLYKNSYTTDLQSVRLSKNQVILSLDAYNEILNDNRTQDYYYRFDDGGVEVLNYPKFLGSKIRIEIYDETNTILVDTLLEIEVVGIFCGRLTYPGKNIYAGDENFLTFSQAAIQYSKIDFSVKTDKTYMTELLSDLREHYILVKNYYTEDIYRFESSFVTFKQLFALVGGILLAFSMVMFANFINVSIETRKKDLGIIRAIGGSGQTIFKLFLIEGLIFAGVVSILSLLGTILGTITMNSLLIRGMVSGCTLMFFEWRNFLIIPILGFVVMLLTTYFPIRKISKNSPVNIIRNG